MTPEPTTALVDARRDALLESGWGATFRFLQPRNAAFWVYLLLCAQGGLFFLAMVRSQGDYYAPAVQLTLVALVLYGIVLWWFFRRIDRYARQSRKLIIVGFFWGGLGAAYSISGAANSAILGLWANLFGQAWANDWAPGLTAPIVEEISKGLGLVLLIALAGRLVATALDGFVLGAFIGLGFQLFEDVQYGIGGAASDFGTDPVGNAWDTLVGRLITGVSGHIVFSAVFGAGLIYFLGRPGQPRRRGYGILLMVVAMLMHGLWDSLGGFFGTLMDHPLLPYFLAAPFVIAFLVVAVLVFRHAVPTERQYLRAVLAPEVADGYVTAEELDALVDGRRARRAYRRGGQHRDRKVRTFRLEAVQDLADELAVSGGHTNDRVLFARAELHRLPTVAPAHH